MDFSNAAILASLGKKEDSGYWPSTISLKGRMLFSVSRYVDQGEGVEVYMC